VGHAVANTQTGTTPVSHNDAPKIRQPWNVIVTAKGDRLPVARRALRTLGHVERTGFCNVLASVDELETFLRRVEQLARVTFDDPDAIVLVETIGGRAGIALHTREDYSQICCWLRTDRAPPAHE
jgi:hypothetical protein